MVKKVRKSFQVFILYNLYTLECNESYMQLYNPDPIDYIIAMSNNREVG